VKEMMVAARPSIRAPLELPDFKRHKLEWTKIQYQIWISSPLEIY
jgi:hypothetical protein